MPPLAERTQETDRRDLTRFVLPRFGMYRLGHIPADEIETDPCDRVDPPRVPKRAMVFLDWDEVLALSDNLVERHRTMILFAVDTGMRWSEIIGLRRHKLDLMNRKVT